MVSAASAASIGLTENLPEEVWVMICKYSHSTKAWYISRHLIFHILGRYCMISRLLVLRGAANKWSPAYDCVPYIPANVLNVCHHWRAKVLSISSYIKIFQHGGFFT